MDNFVEELENYFKNTPRAKVLEDWKLIEKQFKAGPTIDEFSKDLEIRLKELEYVNISTQV